MPELPDVEHMRRVWARHGAGRTVERVVTLDPAIVRNASPNEVDSVTRGHRLEEPERIGKWMIAPSTGPSLLLHFGMIGDIGWAPTADGRHRHDRLIVELDRGELRYRNMRKLGGVWLARDADETKAITGALGPDALSLSSRELMDLLTRRRGMIKAALLDQTFVSGVGNLVADEVLWHARVHPARRIQGLNPEERRRIHSQMRRVLNRWTEGYGSLPRGWLIHSRGLDHPCPRCGTLLSRTVVGGRTTYFCPRCQREETA